MYRRLIIFAAALVLISTQVGCRSSRGSDRRPGWFMSNIRGEAPCQTVGRNTGCFDAVSGQPVPCPPSVPSTVIPGGAYPIGPAPGSIGPRPNELHMPTPADMIRPPAIPYPAPADALLPQPSTAGTPVKAIPSK